MVKAGGFIVHIRADPGSVSGSPVETGNHHIPGRGADAVLLLLRIQWNIASGGDMVGIFFLTGSQRNGKPFRLRKGGMQTEGQRHFGF